MPKWRSITKPFEKGSTSHGRLDGLSPLRGSRIFFRAVFLGLTPQAMDLSPLRGLMDLGPGLFLGLTPQAMNLSPLRG